MDKHIKSNFLLALKPLRALTLAKSCAARLFKFSWNKEKYFVFFIPGFCSTSPHKIDNWILWKNKYQNPMWLKLWLALFNDFLNLLRGCICDNWKPSFLSRLIFNWRTFSRRVAARWWRQWAKNQVGTNQNSINRWIERRIIC